MNRRTALTSVVGFVAGHGLAGCVGSGTDPSMNEAVDTTVRTTSGIDPNRDTDCDGLTTCEERQLEGAEIGRMDVYVEMDWTEGNRPASNELDRLVDVFDGAPVESSNGADPGTNLHLVPDSEIPSKEEPFGLDELRKYRRQFFDNRGRRYHYALFVEEVSPPAFGREDYGDVLVQASIPDPQRMSSMVRVSATSRRTVRPPCQHSHHPFRGLLLRTPVEDYHHHRGRSSFSGPGKRGGNVVE